MSRIRPPDCSKLAKNPKNDNDVTIFRHDVNVKFFWRCFVSLVKFSYWSKFHVNIITGSGIMTIFFYKGLTRNPEIGNTPVWVLPNIWRLERVMHAKFGTNVSNRILLNAAKFQGYSFYRFWVKGKPTVGGWGGKITPPSPHTPRLGLINKETCVLLFDVFKHLLLRNTDFSKLVGKVNFSEKNIWRNALDLKSKKVQGIFGKTFILAVLSLAVFRLQNRVLYFF